MKKSIGNLFLLFVIAGLASCSDQENASLSNFGSVKLNAQLNSGNKDGDLVIIEGVTTFHDLLHFKDLEAFMNAQQSLYNLQEQDKKSFRNLYIPYSDEQLNELTVEQQLTLSDQVIETENQIGYSETGIYQQFEGALNFTSLRKLIEDQETVFLDQSEPDWENNPAHHFIQGEDFQTLYNAYAEVMIEGVIYKMYEDGRVVEITDGSYETLLEIRSNEEIANTLSNVVVHMEGVSKDENEDQVSGKKSCPVDANRNNRLNLISRDGSGRSELFIAERAFVLYSTAFTITTNYTKKNGSWKKSPVWVSNSINGAVWDMVHCGQGSVNDSDRSHTRKLRTGDTFWGHKGTYSNAVSSMHSVWSQNIRLALVW